jgi:hypothetical protein
MDFLRISGELQFVRLLPPEIRRRTIESWYRDAESGIETFVNDALPLMNAPGLPDLGEDPQRALWTRLGERTNASALDRPAGRYADALQPLASVRGPGATLMPELTYLTIVDGERAETWTVLRDTAHTNVATLFREDKRRIPADDALTVAPGFIGAYPNALFLVPGAEVAEFVALVVAMQSDGDYRALLDAYGVRRSDPRFWQHSDRLHGQLEALAFQERGLLDYSRLENR